MPPRYSGTLTVTGTIDPQQFWPNGESDADTAKVRIAQTGAFRFQAKPKATARATPVFYGARMGKKALVSKKFDVTIRFQGIDATELHFPPSSKRDIKGGQPVSAAWSAWYNKYRQKYGETAADALGTYLRTISTNPIPCKVVTRVDSPDDPFDKYGRLVGDIIIKVGGKDVDLNHWVLANGWAMPAFYDSMLDSEIRTLIGLAKAAQSRGMRANYAPLATFDQTLQYRGVGAAPNPGADAGRFLFPKVFRRRCNYEVNTHAGYISGTWDRFLKDAKNDTLYYINEFLGHNSPSDRPKHVIADVVTGAAKNKPPQDLVFHEAPAAPRSIANGKPVTSWWRLP